MRYVAEYQEGAVSLLPEAIHEWRSPATPGVVTGRIRNLHFNYPVGISIYISGRDAQAVVLPPMTELQMVNRPADRITVIPDNSAPTASVFDYLLTVSQAEDQSELPWILSRSSVAMQKIDVHTLTEYIGHTSYRAAPENTSPIIVTQPINHECAMLAARPFPQGPTDQLTVLGFQTDRGVTVGRRTAKTQVSNVGTFFEWGYPMFPFDSRFYSTAAEAARLYYYMGADPDTQDYVFEYYCAPFIPDWPSQWQYPPETAGLDVDLKDLNKSDIHGRQ